MAKNQYCEIYVVRHGQTDWNVKSIIQGQSDIELNKTGVLQAEDLSKKLTNVKFDAVFSSDLMRAKRTAEIIVLEKQLAVKTTQALRERYFGPFEGKDWRQYDREIVALLKKYRKVGYDQKKARMETDESMIGRVIPFLREVAVGYPDKTVLIVSHGGLMRALLIHLGFGTYETLPSGSIGNLGYFKLKSDGVDFFVEETYQISRIG
ncbi:MAG: histidine phosphatase family protein [Patescibacteria group bacterium]